MGEEALVMAEAAEAVKSEQVCYDNDKEVTLFVERAHWDAL
jgi:hypothetical protein